MRIAILADAFPPMRSAAALQLYDLAREMIGHGHQVVALIATPEIETPFVHEIVDGIDVLRLRTKRTKDVSLIQRAFSELLLSFDLLSNLKRSPFANTLWDGIIWYSPTIFLGYAVKHLKAKSNCRAYLILRDIFPDWAVDLGLMTRGPAYYGFKLVETYQYSVADCIGVQSERNMPYLANWAAKSGRRLEVLDNWLSPLEQSATSIDLSDTHLAGRTILVYAGNMGIAQDLDKILALVQEVRTRSDLGFVFVGRGSEAKRLKAAAATLRLENILFFDEIEAKEIGALYTQCNIGIVSLDARHQTHNIPGKFLSYLVSGLPVLAVINPGNDLETMIQTHRVGVVAKAADPTSLKDALEAALDLVKGDPKLMARCKDLADRVFHPSRAALKILDDLSLKA
jgi:glycosyltransferase involved in cell wall biosynthesis